MADKTTELQKQIYEISLTPIDDIYYVPPGVSGSVGLSEAKIDKIEHLFTSRIHQAIAEMEDLKKHQWVSTNIHERLQEVNNEAIDKCQAILRKLVGEKE